MERRRLHEIDWTLKRNGNGIDLPPALYYPTMLPQIIGSQPLVMLSPACFAADIALPKVSLLPGPTASYITLASSFLHVGFIKNA